MESQVMFLDCPEYLDKAGSVRCGLPAEVECRYVQNSSGGPLESAKIRCPVGHWFNAPVEFLTWKKQPAAAHTSGAGTTGSMAAARLRNPGTR